MDVICCEVLIRLGIPVEGLQHAAGAFDATRESGELEGVTPIFYLDFKFIFDLAQVFVKLTTQPGKAAGICRFQFQLMCRYGLVQCGCVIRPSTVEWL